MRCFTYTGTQTMIITQVCALASRARAPVCLPRRHLADTVWLVRGATQCSRLS
jgi:hypothetical protein